MAAQSCLKCDRSSLLRFNAPDWPCAGQLQLRRRLFGRPDSHRRLGIPSRCPDRTHHHTCHQCHALPSGVCQAGKQTASSDLGLSCLAPLPSRCHMGLMHGCSSPCLHLPGAARAMLHGSSSPRLRLLSRCQRRVALQPGSAPLRLLLDSWCRTAFPTACTVSHPEPAPQPTAAAQYLSCPQSHNCTACRVTTTQPAPLGCCPAQVLPVSWERWPLTHQEAA